MPSGDAAIKNSPRLGVPDRMQVHSSSDLHQRQWFPDERDAFISWLRAEFAAANAIIDSLCYHLRCVGKPGEYEAAIGCIQHRRSTWTPVLHMQQYFSVADVVHSLQQVAWRHQTRHPDPATGSFHHSKSDSKKLATHITAGRHVNKGIGTDNTRDSHRSDSDLQRVNQEAPASSVGTKKIPESDTSGTEINKIDHSSSGSVISFDNSEMSEPGRMSSNGVISETNGTKSGDAKEGNHRSAIQKDDMNTRVKPDEKPPLALTPKTFTGTEILDGITVNVVEGLAHYEDFLDGSEVSQLFSLANELRVAGRRGELQGQTFVPSKRPMKGRGREILQFGVPIVDGPSEDNSGTLSFRDHKVAPIPNPLLNIADRLVQLQLMTVKPDSCVIDFFNEGDHSQPHACPSWFGRPLCTLFLTQCSMVFGKMISIDHPGDFSGALKLSLAPGSVLVMKGKSADIARHAIPSIRKQRIMVTFTKPQSKRMIFSDGLHLQSPVQQHSPWGQRPRLPTMPRHPGPKHYSPVPSTGVLPGPPPRPQNLHPADVPPIFVAASVPPPAVYQPPPVLVGTSGWPSAPRPAQPRLLVPGTGVFLPTGPGHHSQSQQQQGVAISGETISVVESSSSMENLSMNGEVPEKADDDSNSHSLEEKMGTGIEGPLGSSSWKAAMVENDENVTTTVSNTEDKEEVDVSKPKHGDNASREEEA